MEPWSIVADHPHTGEPFGIVICDDSTFAEAEDLARQLLATARILGSYIPSRPNQRNTDGHYLVVFCLTDKRIPRLATIWAHSAEDATLRLNTLAADGILFMPASG